MRIASQNAESTQEKEMGGVNVLATRFLLTSGHVVATCLALHALPLAGVEVRLCTL